MRIFRKPRYIGRKSVLALAMVTTAGAGSAISAIPASASTDYSINTTLACHDTYNNKYASWIAVYANFSNPYSWECVAWFGGYYFEDFGPPNFQAYCSITYPGSEAVLVSYDANGWRCQK